MVGKIIFSPMAVAGSNQKWLKLWLEFAGLVALVALTILYLSISWRKWCDPLIDFGDQLYSAWRLSEGAVLYRDVDLLYGPLSQYFNAALFAAFGPGIMILVASNLTIVAMIVALLYLLCRQAWGVIAALVACAVFVAVFAFSQYVHFGNLNYATPYSHETTHGMLVSLLLCFVLSRWIESPAPGRSFVAGALFGLTFVLKPEFMLAAGLMTLVAGLTTWRYYRFLPKSNALIAWAVGAILPTGAFIAYFFRVMPWHGAVSSACHGWLTALTANSFTSDILQTGFLGFDEPWRHLVEHTLATFGVCLVISALAAASWLSDRTSRLTSLVAIAAAVALAFGALSLSIKWISIGRCLLGSMSIYLSICVIAMWREQPRAKSVHSLRLLLALLAIALMARMILNGRIYHYGYYQAAIAATILPAILIGELPAWLRATWRGAAVILVGTLVLLLPAVVILTKQSLNEFRWKTSRIGSGRDEFYAFSPALDPTGEMVDKISAELRKRSEGATLLVLPEGEMINYLARLRNPIPQFFFYDGVTANGREQQIVNELQAQPPFWVVIISRDLGEYGVERYGDNPGNGQEIVRWVEANYKKVGSLGGDPFDYRQHGALLLRRSQ